MDTCPKNWLIKAQRCGPQSRLMRVWNSNFVIDHIRHRTTNTNMKPGKAAHIHQIQISCVVNGVVILETVTLRAKSLQSLNYQAHIVYKNLKDRG